MPIDFDLGVTFVREHGDDFDQARLDRLLLDGSFPSDEVIGRFPAGQRADGGWAPFWATEYSSLDATCYRLAQAETLTPYRPAFQRGVAFLVARQRPDGSFEEDESAHDLAPHWAKPGDLAARLYLTANCGWWLINGSMYIKYVATDQSVVDACREAARRAGAYLERHLAPDGSLPSFLQTYWLAAALWIRLNWPPRDPSDVANWREPDVPDLARRALDHLATLLDDETPAGALGWMLTTLAPLGVPPEHPAIVKAIALLGERQRADGGWTSEDGPDHDAYATAQALLALIQWRAI